MKERGILKMEREARREMDDEEEIELCSIHPHIRFMVDIIDVSILVVITVRVCGDVFNHAQIFPTLHLNKDGKAMIKIPKSESFKTQKVIHLLASFNMCHSSVISDEIVKNFVAFLSEFKPFFSSPD